MKSLNFLQSSRAAACLAFVLAFLSASTTVRANVYATDIQLNGSLMTITNASSNPVTITYRLNQPATAGVTVAILQGITQVATIAGGTAAGLNSVLWGCTNNSGAPVASGVYSVSITAGATGFPVWTQISPDSTNNVAVDPEGIAVNNNTNSPYYGRILLGCASAGTANGVSQLCGIYKMNADGSPADEGGFGYGAYTTNDAGNSATGEMASGSGFNPWRLRIGEDDRLYIDDYSDYGAIVAFDMRVTTNQVVLKEANYTGNPFFDSFSAGLGNFDIAFTTTTNATVWMCCNDSINFGLWYWHLTNGAASTNDIIGTWAVEAGPTSDLSMGSSGGCMVDGNLDFFVSQNQPGPSSAYTTMLYTNWDKGSVWPTNTTTEEDGQQMNQVLWGVGTNDDTFEDVQDTVIDNRQHPNMVALPMLGGGDNFYPGIRVLSAIDGSVVTVTNSGGTVIQALTNLDFPNQYSCAAWDNVGNLYGAASSLNYWRVWSPPGANQATTIAVAQVQVIAPPPPPYITGISLSGGNVIISFTAGSSELASSFTLVSSATVNGAYLAVVGASITGSSGSYQASAPRSGSTQFYRLKQSN